MPQGLDYETFSDVDIKTHGLDRYINSPNFAVLWAATYDHNSLRKTYDFVCDPDAKEKLFDSLRHEYYIIAHNAGFERAVSDWLGYGLNAETFLDSAVIARAAGAASRLEAAAPQLLDGSVKMEVGRDLIRTFSVPTKANGGRPYTAEELKADDDLWSKWMLFGDYCGVDAELGFKIADDFGKALPTKEFRYEVLTQQMNDAGWYVDVPLVKEMQRRYKENLAELEAKFYQDHGQINFRSYTQLQKWCAERGVRAKSFDKMNLPKLIRKVSYAVDTTTDPVKRAGYAEVLYLLQVKQEMGGSSLSKLQTILDMVGPGDRLRNQYLHVGASQSFRTSGRGVQMQNLVRLPETLPDVEELYEKDADWDNEQLAQNVRQCFKAEHPDGVLVVGDFSSVESRGLAYLAGERWKLNAYAEGKDIYKMLATTYQSFNGVAYEDVTKPQRQAGKVGELACGYGAGARAVAGFAEKMGMNMSETEAEQIVADWRGANSNVVSFWKTLDQMLRDALTQRSSSKYVLTWGGSIRIHHTETPSSLLKQHPGAQSLMVTVLTLDGSIWMKRVFHGCYLRGTDICYYKPSELKSGDLWRARMTEPPHAWYKLYGGKLAGIITQSFCRELFFSSLRELDNACSGISNVKIIGQFHDEIVVEWSPEPWTGAPRWSLQRLIDVMDRAMSRTPWRGFPLAADIKYGHRYIK